MYGARTESEVYAISYYQREGQRELVPIGDEADRRS